MWIFAGKWISLIIFWIKHRIIRCEEFKPAILNISGKILIEKLESPCNKALITKKQYPEILPHVESFLTPLVEKVLPIIDEIAKFGVENL